MSLCKRWRPNPGGKATTFHMEIGIIGRRSDRRSKQERTDLLLSGEGGKGGREVSNSRRQEWMGGAAVKNAQGFQTKISRGSNREGVRIASRAETMETWKKYSGFSDPSTLQLLKGKGGTGTLVPKNINFELTQTSEKSLTNTAIRCWRSKMRLKS